MLTVNVGTLIRQDSGTIKLVDVNDTVEADDKAYYALGQVKLTKTGRCIVAEADLQVTTTLSCGRCLKDFQATYPVHFTEEYYTKENLLHIAHEENEQDDLEDWFLIDGANILDLSEAIRQYSIIAEPISPVCDENCNPLR